MRKVYTLGCGTLVVAADSIYYLCTLSEVTVECIIGYLLNVEVEVGIGCKIVDKSESLCRIIIGNATFGSYIRLTLVAIIAPTIVLCVVTI